MKVSRKKMRKYLMGIIKYLDDLKPGSPEVGTYHPTGYEFFELLRRMGQNIDFDSKDFAAFWFYSDNDVCEYGQCSDEPFCQHNPIEKSYYYFNREWGPFSKYDYVRLRLALRF